MNHPDSTTIESPTRINSSNRFGWNYRALAQQLPTLPFAITDAHSHVNGARACKILREAMDLCVSCKGCKRECPTGVDMAKMKLEFIHHDKQKNGLTLRDKIIGNLPKYGPLASRFPMIANAMPSPRKARSVNGSTISSALRLRK